MKSLSLPKTGLLTKSWEYQHVYKHGKRLRGKDFSLIFLANQRGEDRLGLSISGVKLAVQRNRLKRMIREFYRHNRSFPSLLGATKGILETVDLVIATRRPFRPKNLHELSSLLLPYGPTNLPGQATAQPLQGRDPRDIGNKR